ncbi:OadG family transporter subunit [Pseudomonadota bacterium]|nr:OadG family transporter subunit [Pseudomonadota bacterium]
MIEQDILMQEGMNLLYSGMVVVFSFLLLLIISVNLLRIVFSSKPQKNISSTPASIKNDVHHKIIKEVLGGIRS